MKKFFDKLPKTYLAFPVDQVDSKNRSPKKRGVALIIAIMAVAMIMIFASSAIVNSTVNLEMAMSSRDNVKAEFMARSGQNLAAFLLMADWAVDLALYSGKLGAKIPPTDNQGDFWSALNGLPVGGDTIEMVAAAQEKFDLNSINDGEVIDTLKLFDGDFIVDIKDEGSRINIAKCGVDKCLDTLLMLEALMSCPSEKLFLERKNLVPKQMAHRIKDWLDTNTTTEESGFGTEDDPYEKKFPPYASKNAPMESLNELLLIEGWDEEMHEVFSPYLTIYPYMKQKSEVTQVNINTVSKELLACLFPNAKSDCAESFYKQLIERQESGGGFASDKGSIQKFLKDGLCGTSGDAESGEKDRSGWFTTRSSVYRISVIGRVGMQEKKIEMVIERSVPDKSKKVENSYNILYWKMT